MLKLGIAAKLLLSLGLVGLAFGVARTSRRRASESLAAQAKTDSWAASEPQLRMDAGDEGSAFRRMVRRGRTVSNRREGGFPMKKRLIIGAVAAVAAFASVFGMAASLTMSADGLGASSAAVSACDANGVSTSYTTAWDAADARYEVSTVTVGGIADACDGKSVKIALTDNGGALISGATGTGTVSTASGSADARTLAISIGTPASAASVSNVNAVIG